MPRRTTPLTPIFRPRITRGARIGTGGPVGESVIVEPVDIAHGSTLGSPAVTALTDVAPSDLAQASTLDSPTVTANAEAAPDDLAHASTLDSPTVTSGAPTAAPDDLAHAHTLDQPSVTGDADAAPDDLAHGHTLDSPTVSEPFSPDDIASLEVWLDADSESYSDDGNVATATDLSGNSNDFDEISAGQGPTYKTGIINGRAVYRFAAGEELVAASNFASGFTAAEMFVVFNVPDATPPAVNAAPFIAQGQTTLGTHIPWTNGIVYDSFGSTARKTVGTPSPSTALESFVCYNARSASGSWVAELDGAAFFSTGTNTVGFSHAPRMGETNHGGNRSWLGDVAAVYMFSAVLSSGDRDDMETYISDRFGITFA